jgi:hypothetical protein
VQISSKRKIRIAPLVHTDQGVASVGPIISINRNRDDFYVSLSKCPTDMKISLHASGIMRWAKNSIEPRPPLARIERSDLRTERRWHTVFRAMYVPYKGNYLTGNIVKNRAISGVPIPYFGDTIVVYSLGYLHKENLEYVDYHEDFKNKYVEIFELSENFNAYLFLTASYYSRNEIWKFSNFSAHKNSAYAVASWESFTDGSYAIACQFMSKIHTHSYFILHSIERYHLHDDIINHPFINVLNIDKDCLDPSLRTMEN